MSNFRRAIFDYNAIMDKKKYLAEYRKQNREKKSKRIALNIASKTGKKSKRTRLSIAEKTGRRSLRLWPDTSDDPIPGIHLQRKRLR